MADEYPAGWYQDPDDASLIRYWDGEDWTDQTRVGVPAGWYPDPEGDPTFERYWDGAAWTGVTQPVVGAAPVASLEVTEPEVWLPGGGDARSRQSVRPAGQKPARKRPPFILIPIVLVTSVIAVFGFQNFFGSTPEPTQTITPTTPPETPETPEPVEPTPEEPAPEEPAPVEPTPEEPEPEKPNPVTPPKPGVEVPSPLSVKSTGVHSTSLSWDKVSGATYEIQRSTSSNFTGAETLKAKTASLQEKDLPTATTYYYRVRAVVKGKKSDWTAAKKVSLKGVASSAPVGVAVTVQRRAAVLTWQPPATLGSAEITTYIVQRDVSASFKAPTEFRTVELARTDSGLAVPMTYYYRVAALNADQARSPWSTTVVVSTVLQVPLAPTSFSAKMTKADVLLQWASPVDDGGAALTGYVITRATNSAFTSGKKTFQVTTAPFVDTTVDDNVKYYYRVVATNSVGSSAVAGTSISTPLIASPPSAARSVVAAVSAGNITVSWGSPSSNGGASVTGYTIQYSTSKSMSSPKTVSTTSKSYTFKKVTRNTNFYFRVAAKNAAGTGAWSSVIGPYNAPYTEPGAPQSVAFKYKSSDRTYTISWKPPVDDGGREVIFYYVQSSYNGSSGWTMARITKSASETSYTTSSRPSNKYYRIIAVTSGGSSQGGKPSAVIHLQ